MRRVFVVLLALVAVFSIAGCKTGIQVQDNTYDALGGQVIKVSDTFTYVGDCDPAVLTTSAQGRARVDSGVKTRGDVFIRTIDGKPSEFIIIQRLMITKTGWSWNPGPGDPVKFYGSTFKEAFFDSKRGDQTTINSYMAFVRHNGYSLDTPDFYIRSLTRNSGSQSRVAIYYGVYPGEIPDDVRGDYAREAQFIRDRFDASVSVIQ